MGSPVSNGTMYALETNLFVTSDTNDFVSVMSPSYTSGYNGVSGTISRYWLYDFSNSLSWNSIDETTDKIKGSGFAMKGLGETINFVFAGKPNNGNIKLELDENKDSLIGNPSLSEINADDFNTYHVSNSITDGTFYLWDQPTGNSHNISSYEGGYATRIAGVGVPTPSIIIEGTAIGFTKTPNEFISVGQGFVVAGITDASEITFKNSFRDFGDAVFFKPSTKSRNSQKSPIQLIRLAFEYDTPEVIFHRQLVTSPRGMTFGFDLGKDARMFDYFGTEMCWDLQNDLRCVINSVPDLIDELEISLGLILEKKRR
jgi:hypothetical protein